MNEETTNLTEQEAEKKKVLPFIIVAAALIALIVGIGIYNTPANRVRRQLELGQKYLEEENYEQAIVEFNKAIAIDDRCMEAYIGGIKSYQGLDDKEGLPDIYERALDAAAKLEESELAENMETVVEIYLAADDVYSDNLEKVVQVMEDGLKLTEDTKIKDRLIEDYLNLAKDYTDKGDYEKALEIYDRLKELGAENDEVSDLANCLDEYFAMLRQQEETGENGAWVDDLYQKMISGDAEAVYAIILEPDFIEKCSEYAFESQVVDNFSGTHYGLLTSEGKIIVINEYIHPAGADYAWSIYAFYCVHEDEPRIGFVPETVSGGDYFYEFTSPEAYNGKVWLIGDTYYSLVRGDGVLPYGEIFRMLFSAVGG